MAETNESRSPPSCMLCMKCIHGDIHRLSGVAHSPVQIHTVPGIVCVDEVIFFSPFVKWFKGNIITYTHMGWWHAGLDQATLGVSLSRVCAGLSSAFSRRRRRGALRCTAICDVYLLNIFVLWVPPCRICSHVLWLHKPRAPIARRLLFNSSDTRNGSCA